MSAAASPVACPAASWPAAASGGLPGDVDVQRRPAQPLTGPARQSPADTQTLNPKP